MSQMTLKIKKVGTKNSKTKVLGFASRAIANGTQSQIVCEETHKAGLHQGRATRTAAVANWLSPILLTLGRSALPLA